MHPKGGQIGNWRFTDAHLHLQSPISPAAGRDGNTAALGVDQPVRVAPRHVLGAVRAADERGMPGASLGAFRRDR